MKKFSGSLIRGVNDLVNKKLCEERDRIMQEDALVSEEGLQRWLGRECIMAKAVVRANVYDKIGQMQEVRGAYWTPLVWGRTDNRRPVLMRGSIYFMVASAYMSVNQKYGPYSNNTPNNAYEFIINLVKRFLRFKKYSSRFVSEKGFGYEDKFVSKLFQTVSLRICAKGFTIGRRYFIDYCYYSQNSYLKRYWVDGNFIEEIIEKNAPSKTCVVKPEVTQPPPLPTIATRVRRERNLLRAMMELGLLTESEPG